MSSLMERLGLAPQDRVVIIHADDVGACHAANLGSFATLEAGIVSCGSILVPSPWVSGGGCLCPCSSGG